MRVPWTARRSNQSILKEINHEYSLEGLMLKLKLQYFGHLMQRCKELTHWKRSWCWERLRAVGEGDDRGQDGWMASWTQWMWVWANSWRWWRTGQGSLECCSPWGHKESDTTELLNNNNMQLNIKKIKIKKISRRPKYTFLCDPTDGSPPGSAIPGILQARTLEWVAISFSNAWKWKVKVKSLSRVWLFATPWTAAYQAPPSMGFSRQEYWSGVPLPSPQMVTAAMKLKDAYSLGEKLWST